ncbi:MAG: Asp-tRNA(Asn)/Glu-tRNA(Gln) amidotransferase subunit GatB [ANME-2 cluster archaeon]|nr:Asp-tRNA(Asn)/Glu-tRNA(Gln) amidotransferase subunit GatB [ANME-2 cluster archaeon]MBC2700006.1 Asp-tRNA(Asn)/Glu-tRNA(Gln) amidotransferase subunit GatB [ANME-2 cluster archaeon]MBC2707477.1 Asp-tRNA(Asn)/Glu-tRNA(Gln) amidotransferase subunit GatB [ANME-2 cluster archaeon]MBC2746302.1 Asp-tRNA(Asn)/Glu-tRNA(Gln) amidotransferase subunit GatB [ANME-2 cluster archaeon]MBC2762398.1 Asp-tRNA(Asn)/Glu-tRNA(Gln) amidotransferase subunit GatB [ANME-2 cluster archaeon]
MREESLKLRPYLDEVGVMIGLEIHVQLNKLNTKIFCGCPLDYHDDGPNTHTCPVCLGLPGSLPVINRKSVEYSIKVGLALNCSIEEHTQFYRKNYYYPDLPKGFQITQYDYPIASSGYINIEGEDGEVRVRINRAHMEEDPGRLVHEGGSIERSKYTLIDYNRSGVALLEIVTEPDIRSPKEARRFLDKLRNILEYLDVVDTTLEGSMRVDANISLSGGSRSEVKNISSHKGAERALLFEIVRQKNLLRRGGKVVQETRHFDEARGVTVSLRTKEEAHDYRYFPEADLVSLRVADWAPGIAKTLPELPDARRERFVSQYDITDDHAKSLTSEKKVADFYEQVAAEVDSKLAAVWIADVLKGELNYRDLGIDAFASANMVQMVKLLAGDKITEQSGVEVIRTILDEGGTPDEVVAAKGLLKAGGDLVTAAVEEVISENPGAVADYQNGKQEAVNFLMGQVMKKTKGRADAKEVRKMIIQRV